jgi:hypothetical protein
MIKISNKLYCKLLIKCYQNHLIFKNKLVLTLININLQI